MPPNYSFTPSLYFSGKELWGLGRILWQTEFKQLNYMRTLCTWQVMCKWQICLCGMSIKSIHQSAYSFPGGSDGKESANNMGSIRDAGLIPGLGRFPWRRAWLPTPVFLPGESMDRGAWRALVHSVTKSRTWLTLSLLHPKVQTLPSNSS